MSDYWIAKVVEPYKKVEEAGGKDVLGVHLDFDDEYLVVQYLHFECETQAGGFKYKLKPGYPESVLWEQGSIVPYKMKGIMQKGNIIFIY